MQTKTTTKPITWSDLLYLQELSHQNFNKFATEYARVCHRTDAMQEFYDEHKKALAMMGMTTAEYLKKVELKVKDNETFIKVTKNNFPYNLEESISHDLIWLSEDLNSSIVYANIALKYVQGKKRFILLQAPEQSRSIPEIIHYHLFIKT